MTFHASIIITGEKMGFIRVRYLQLVFQNMKYGK